jgi:putative ABC transport system substrate-binding protein
MTERKLRIEIFHKPSLALFTLAAFLLNIAVCSAAEVAIIKSKNIQSYNEAITGFTVNCNLKITEYDMEGNRDRGIQIAKKIGTDKPDLVFVVGAEAAVVAKDNLKDIPVLYAMVLDPAGKGIAGENIAGISLDIPVKTQLNTLKSISPKTVKIGVIYNPRKTGTLVEEARAAAKELGLTLIDSKIDTAEDVPRALRAFAEGIDAFWMVPDPSLGSEAAFKAILDFTLDKKIPFLAFSKAFVEHGALISLAANYANIGQQACTIATKIMQGTKPAKIGMNPPKGLELTFNLTTAKKIGIENIAANAISFAASEGYKISVSQ